MFKAINEEDNTEIIILASRWANNIDNLRRLSAEDRLICQECEKPVIVRAGKKRRWHFAHRQLSDCKIGSESAALLQARALLYNLLVREYGEDAVTLEVRIDAPNIPRPVDCWVKRPKGDIAYWVIERGIRSVDARWGLKHALSQEVERVHWLFIQSSIGPEADASHTVDATHIKKPLSTLLLSASQRDFMVESSFDGTLTRHGFQNGTSLQFLDPEQEVLVTYRNLELVHDPQMYRGERHSHPISEVSIAKRTGELVHPGERERREERIKKRGEMERRKQKVENKNAIVDHSPIPHSSPTILTLTDFPDRPSELPLPTVRLSDREGICIYCGCATTDWVSFDGITGQCKCRSCMRGRE